MEKSNQDLRESTTEFKTSQSASALPVAKADQTWMRICRVCEAQNAPSQLSCLLCESQLPNPTLVYRAGTEINGKYQIIRLLGHGAMGFVYEAEHLRLKRRVALKFLHPSLFGDEKLAQRFHREALTAAAIEHPNVLQVLDLEGSSEGAPILVTELLQGQDLDRAMTQEKRFAPERIIALLSQALSALSAAHERGIIHRDIKPHNLFLSAHEGKERLTVIDFGIAKILEPSAETMALTTRGLAIGTPDYMSPEQINALPLDPRADLWSVGVILYQLLMGRLPFHAPTQMGTALTVLNKKPDFSSLAAQPALVQGLGALCRRVLAKDREARPASAAAFREELLALLARDQQPEPSLTITAERPATPKHRRYAPLLVAAAAVAILGLWLTSRATPAPRLVNAEPPALAPASASAPILASDPPETQPSPATIEATQPSQAPKKSARTRSKAQSTSLPPGQSKLTYAKGLVMSRQYKEATKLLEEVIKEEPQNDSAHRWLGDAYAALGKKPQAVREWETFLRLSPTHPDARKVRSDIESLRL